MNKIYLIKKGLNDNIGSYHILNKEINKIINNSKEVNKFSLNETSLSEILESASYYGLFNEEKVYIIDDVKYFGGKFLYEDELNILYNFLNNDNNLSLIFICDDISINKASTKKIKEYNANILDITNITEDEKINFIKEYLLENNITMDDIKYLLNNCYSNLDFAINEIDKLSNIDNHITNVLIDEYGISLIKNDNLSFDFKNAVIERKYGQIFDLYDKLIENNIDEASIIGLLASSFEDLFIVKECLLDGLNDEEIAKIMNIKNVGRIYYLKKDVRFYTLDDLKSKILELSELDKKIKTGFNPVYSIKNFLLNV